MWRAEDLVGLRTQALLTLHESALPEAGYLAGLSLLAQGETQAGTMELSRLAEAWPTQPLGWQTRLVLAEHLSDEAPAAAPPFFDLVLDDEPPEDLARQARRGRARSYARMGQFPHAAESLADAGEDLDTLTSAVADARRWRSPGVAKWLALAPGLGHLYAGSERQALSAFLVNAVFAGGIAYAAHEESWGLVGVLGFFGAGFYVGNLYGAADAARRHNRGVLRSIDSRLDAAGWTPPPAPMPTPDWVPGCYRPVERRTVGAGR